MNILEQIKLLKEKIHEIPPEELRKSVAKITKEQAEAWAPLEKMILEKKE